MGWDNHFLETKPPVIYGIDGNQETAFREGFTNLQECPCGFGDTKELALTDLLKQEEE
jgi:hypothetical protein